MIKFGMVLAGLAALVTGAAAGAPPVAAAAGGAHDFVFTSIDDGAKLPLEAYRGKVLLVVNTASRCGFTKQYDGLQALYEKYSGEGLVVLGVPSNDFMGQEPGTNEEIKEFCETNFGITFPMTEKVAVKGPDAHPFYRWAKAQPNGDSPGWNFHKFLISRSGALIGSYGARTAPDDEKVLQAVETALAQKE
jgi:glutathione peroxidase